MLDPIFIFAQNKKMKKIITLLLLIILIFPTKESFGQKTKEIAALMEKVQVLEQDDSTADVVFILKGLYNWLYCVNARYQHGTIKKKHRYMYFSGISKERIKYFYILPNGRQQKFLVITKINDQYTYIKFTEFNINYSKLAKREVLMDQKYLRVKKYRISSNAS